MTTLHQVWYGTVARTGAFDAETGGPVTHPVLRGLDARFVEAVHRAGWEKSYVPGEDLFCQGATADRFFLVQAGFVALEVALPDRPTLRIGTLGAGDALGRSQSQPASAWPFQGRAVEATSVTVLESQALRAAVRAWPKAGTRLLGRLVPWNGRETSRGPILSTRSFAPWGKARDNGGSWDAGPGRGVG